MKDNHYFASNSLEADVELVEGRGMLPLKEWLNN